MMRLCRRVGMIERGIAGNSKDHAIMGTESTIGCDRDECGEASSYVAILWATVLLKGAIYVRFDVT
jgi:hypothetical protein